MPKKFTPQKLTATTPQIMNTIRANASDQYQSLVPEATQDVASLRGIWNVLEMYQPLRNEFLSSLINRIGRVIITSKMWENPWAPFKRGLLEFGETVEEIFVNIAKPFQYDPDTSVTDVFKRVIPDVRAAFHTLNYQKFYKTTVSNDQLRTAFLSWEGITDLIGRIVDSMYTGAAYDEFLTMKYLLARSILEGDVGNTEISTISEANMKSITTTILGYSNNMEFMSTTRNRAGVSNFTKKPDQFLIVTGDFLAKMNVDVLATAFNMEKAEFMGHLMTVDSLANLDNARLGELFATDPTYKEITAAQSAILDTVPAVIVSRDFFMIFDNFYNFTEQYNGEGLYWNYWYHTWKTFSTSPFAEAQAFTSTASSVTAVAVSPATASTTVGQSINFTASVTGTGIYDPNVTWSVNSNISTINADGVLTVPATETATSLTVKATSVGDPTKTGTATVTITT